MQYLYENYQTSLAELKKEHIKWHNVPCSWTKIECCDDVHRFTAIQSKYLHFVEVDNLILKLRGKS